MRVLSVIAIWILVIGGLSLFLRPSTLDLVERNHHQQSLFGGEDPSSSLGEEGVTSSNLGDFWIVISSSFPLDSDEYSVDSGTPVVVIADGERRHNRGSQVSPVYRANLQSIPSEVLAQVFVPSRIGELSQAARMQVLHGDSVIWEQTRWGRAGESLTFSARKEDFDADASQRN